MIELVEVNKSNWVKCAELELHDDQRGNLASNLATIAESKFEEHYVLRAINNSYEVVGMLAYCPEIDEDDPGLYWLFRIMIDKKHQGKGYGRKAIELALNEIKNQGADRVRTMCKPSNFAAAKLYKSLGFNEIGKLDDGDIEFETKL